VSNSLRTIFRRLSAVLGVAALGVLIVGCGSPATVDQAPSMVNSYQVCAGLEDLELSATNITGVEVVSNGFTPPAGTLLPAEVTVLDIGPFCRVSAISEPAIRFEVWLPLEGWNGKYQGVGNGGMAGRISYLAMATALKRGYATASTDTGHRAGPVAFDASWARGRMDLIDDFGHRGLHVTTVNAKRIVEKFYGQPSEYAYYVGCSKGGQQGLMEAQRYPADFDGLIAGDPANDWTRFYAGAHLWYSLATQADPESYIPAENLAALGASVNAACDALDGVNDGVLQDPRTCRFDPATLLCPAGESSATCLTPKQVTAVNKIWSGSRDSSGNLIYPGLVPGGEASTGGWSLWVTGDRPFSSLHWLGGEGFFRHFVFEDPDWDFRTFDFDDDLAFALDKVGEAVDADDPDLRPLRDHGAKLLVYHGWSDSDISPLSAIDYFDQVVEVVGQGRERSSALAETQEFFRLFMVPGMGHCSGGPGADQFDALTALEKWVEGGVAPEQIVASKMEADQVLWTRPLCPYPQAAVWDQTGNIDVASSFACEASGPEH
jgi:feruloyl esterase